MRGSVLELDRRYHNEIREVTERMNAFSKRMNMLEERIEVVFYESFGVSLSNLMELEQQRIDAIAIYERFFFHDGRINWSRVEELLNRPINQLSEAERLALARLFLGMTYVMRLSQGEDREAKIKIMAETMLTTIIMGLNDKKPESQERKRGSFEQWYMNFTDNLAPALIFPLLHEDQKTPEIERLSNTLAWIPFVSIPVEVSHFKYAAEKGDTTGMILSGLGIIPLPISPRRVKKILDGRGTSGGNNLVIPSGAPLSTNELKRIGEPSKNNGIRQVNGTATDARTLFDNQVVPSTVREVQPGVFVGQDINGLTYTFRVESSTLSNNVPTIDITGIPGLRKIKFIGD